MSAPSKTKLDSPNTLRITNGYPVNFDQLARLLQASEVSPAKRLNAEELSASIGVASSHAQFLCAIAQALGLITANNHKPTVFGALVVRCDPFFDDLGTLWFLHYTVASDPKHIVWARLAGEFVPEHNRFDIDQFRGIFEDLRTQYKPSSYARNVKSETRSLLDAYTQQAFARLAYIRADGDGFALSYREAMPPLVLAACIARFRDRHRPGATALSIEEILTAPNSPGRICLLPADRVRNALEALRSQPGFALESRADLDQVRLTDNTPDYTWMERYYADR